MAKFALLFLLLIASLAWADDPGSWTKGRYANNFGARNYYLYTPENRPAANLPLMVMLHGCEQDPAGFAALTGMNAVAEKYGFAVLYPEQTNSDNLLRCWNWFKPENQTRDSGELGLVVGMVKQVEAKLPIDTDRVYVAGFSAGAAMTANLIACYADIFAGAGIHSGLEYEAARSEAEAWKVQASGATGDLGQEAVDAIKNSGPHARLPAIVIMHGRADQTVNPVNSQRILRQMSLIDDLLDDGSANGSQNLTSIAKLNKQVPGGHSYSMEFFGGAGDVHIEDVVVDQMGHAWSGAHVRGAPDGDPNGPDASEMIWLFMWNYSLKRI